jgi:hypothetical protein
MFGNIFKTLAGRAFGVIGAGVVAWINAKGGGFVTAGGPSETGQVAVTVDPMAIGTAVATTLGAYAGVHRLVSRFVNPGDAAKGRVATAEKNAADHGGTVQIPAGKP